MNEMKVTTEEAKTMARRLTREGERFAGTSSGANVVAALRVAEQFCRCHCCDPTVDTGISA